MYKEFLEIVGNSRGLPCGDVATFGSLGTDIGGVGGFFSEEKNFVLEARSIFYAVRYAESRYPLELPDPL